MMLGIADYLWRLVPGNPILRRVVESASKRRRDLFVRCGYLALLILSVVFVLFGSNSDYSSGSTDLAALTKASAVLFQRLSYLQLGLVALLAPVFTAGAITQEKDSQTYDILLATPLTNGQIVLGSLLSRCFFVIALLLSGIPIFSVTQLFGGVSINSIVLSLLIAVSTTILTGSMAMAIATFKIGTRRTIFSFYLFIAVFLVGVYLLDQLDYFHLHFIDASGSPAVTATGWLTPIHPFLALRSIFHDKSYLPPTLADLPPEYRGWPTGWYLTSPASFYICFTLLLSAAMILPSIALLRRLAQSTTSIKTWTLQKLHLSSGDRTRKPRLVWHNPIAWREARTKASAARATFLRYAFMILGIGGAIVLLILHCQTVPASQFIDASLAVGNNGSQTLFIDGDDQHKKTLSVASGVTVLIGNRPGTVDDLSGHWAVSDYAVDSQNALTSITLSEMPRRLSAAQTRTWLLGFAVVEFSAILLIISNAAASTVTREKEDGTLDLLLSTPITSHYYIWGKLRGLVSFVLPLIAVPVVSCLIFIAHDLIRWLAYKDKAFDWIVLPESLVLLPGMLVMVCAVAAILGMQMSLRCRTTVRAVMSSVGIVVGACALAGWCGFNVLGSANMNNDFTVGMGTFSPFTLLTLLLDPYDFAGSVYDMSNPNNDPNGARLAIFFICMIAIALYALAVRVMYKSMVKNFDMTIRRQSR